MSSGGQVVGMVIYIATVLAMGIYFWLIFFMNSHLVAQILVFITLTALLSIVAWIGYDMATTSPAKSSDYDVMHGTKSR